MVVKPDDCSCLKKNKARDHNLREVLLSPIPLIPIMKYLYAASKADPGGQQAQRPCVVTSFKSEKKTGGEKSIKRPCFMYEPDQAVAVHSFPVLVIPNLR